MGIAAIFWLLQKMSQEYRYVITVEATYANTPDSLVLVQPLPDELKLKITATGWQLFRYGVMFNLPVVAINLEDYSGSSVLPLYNMRASLTEQLSNRYQVESVFPSQISLNWQPQVVRMLPIRLVNDIRIDPQFGLKGAVSLTPDSAQVTGPASIVDTMTAVWTDTVQLKDVDASSSGDISLSKDGLPNVTLRPKEVAYQFDVQSFTEASFQLPIRLTGAMAEQVSMLQQTVTLHFQLPVDDYGLLTDSAFLLSFDVVASADGLSETDSTLALQLSRQPENIRKPVLQNQEVRFLFKKP